MSKWKEETVPSLIRLGTIPPSTCKYRREKRILNHVNEENNTLRVSLGSVSQGEEEGAGARPRSALRCGMREFVNANLLTQQRGENRIVLESHDRRAGLSDFQCFFVLGILRAGPRWHVLSIEP